MIEFEIQDEPLRLDLDDSEGPVTILEQQKDVDLLAEKAANNAAANFAKCLSNLGKIVFN